VSGADRAQLRQTLERLWRELENQTQLSATDALVSAEVALGTVHGPLRLGWDSNGERHLLVPMRPGDSPIEDRKSSGVHVDTKNLLVGEALVTFADLHCRRPDLTAVFTGLVADVCERIAVDPTTAPSLLLQALESWRELLAGSEVPWSVTRLAGLYGELSVLERLLHLDRNAGNAWSGPFGAAQDFRSIRHALEVKTTTSREGRTVRVHGSDQLERPAMGKLDLVWMRLATPSQPDGETVNDLIQRCLALSHSPATILAALDASGFPAEASIITETRFELLEERWLPVEEGFPRITPDCFASGAIPAGVSQVEYLVDLDTVKCPNADAQHVLEQFVGDL
jgi:hypothetical protein